MQQVLAQSAAATTLVGPILDSTGASYTSAVIGDLNITKNGTTAAMAAAATLTHDHNGHYILVFTTGNTDTLGRLDISCNKATYAMPPKCFEVLTTATFNTLVTNGTLASTTSGRTIVTDAAGLVDSNTVKLGPTGAGTAQTARDIGASVLLSSGTGTGQLSITSGIAKVDVDTIKTNPVVNAGTITFPTTATLASTTNITAGTITTATAVTTVNGLAANVITAAATAADFGAEMATAIWTDTTAGDFTTALSVGKSIMNGVSLGTGLTVARCTLTDTLTTYTGNTVQTGDSYARIGAAGVSLTAVALADATSDAVIADAVWNAATATYGSAGSYGLLIETDLDATVSSRLASASYTAPTNLTAAQIATGVWQDSTAGDFTTASSIGKALYIANIAPGASGGHFISGSNAGTTTFGAFTVTGATTHTGNVSMAAGLNITQSSGNTSALVVTGTGTGAGAIFSGGTSGNGITATGGTTLGHGFSTTGGVGGSGYGINAVGVGTSQFGIFANGGTNADGFRALGAGTGDGASFRGGNGATSNGITALSGGTNGDGIASTGAGSGHGWHSVGGATGNALTLTGGSASGHGLAVTTTSGDGFNLSPTAGHGINLAANGTSKHGLFSTGGTAGTSDGISAVAGTGGVPIRGDITGNITGTLSTVTTLTNLPAITAGWLTATGIAADAITAAKIADGAIDAATFAASAITSSALATDCIGAAQLAADCIGSSELAASAVTEIQSGLSTLTSAQAATAVLTTAMTESYNTDGAAPTLTQAAMVIMQMLTEMSISGTTMTVKKLDGSTTALTLTLDSTTPTSVTRAT